MTGRGPAPNYSASVYSVVCCYYDTGTFLRIIEDAVGDEQERPATATMVYGLDNCDLAPYLRRSVRDQVYRVSRTEMVDALTRRSVRSGNIRVLVPPATLVEYCDGILQSVKKMEEFREAYRQLKTSGLSMDRFGKLINSTYREIRRIVSSDAGIPELQFLHDALEDGRLCALEQVLDGRDISKVKESERPRRLDAAYEYLSRRRVGKQNAAFSTGVDLANLDLFFCLREPFRKKDYTGYMTTSGFLTLDAYRRCELASGTTHGLSRHIATPFLRVRLAESEPSSDARVRILKTALSLLQMIRDEILRVDEARWIIEQSVKGVSPSARVRISSRLLDLVDSWLKLIFRPYFKGELDDEEDSAAGEPVDVDAAIHWTRENDGRIEEIEHRAASEAKTLARGVGLFDSDLTERFVPSDERAKEVLAWLAEGAA